MNDQASHRLQRLRERFDQVFGLKTPLFKDIHHSGAKAAESTRVARLNFAALPDDIILIVMCINLTPSDLLSLSNVSIPLSLQYKYPLN